MPKTDILSVQEIDAFLGRLRATVIAAQENESIKVAIADLLQGGALRVAATPARPRAAKVTPPVAVERHGRFTHVPNEQIVEVLSGTPDGMSMRELQAALNQHPETIRLKLRTLRVEGRVATTGPRNNLRYHAADLGAALVADGEDAPAGEGEPKARKRVRSKSRKAARSRVRSSAPQNGAAADLDSEFLTIVRNAGEAGVQMSSFTSQFKLDPKSIRKVLERLRGQGIIQRSGHRRSTRYTFVQ